MRRKRKKDIDERLGQAPGGLSQALIQLIEEGQAEETKKGYRRN